MIPDFDPRRYPGPRASGPVLVHDGALHPLVLDGPAHAPLRIADAASSATSASSISAIRPSSAPSPPPILADLQRRRWSVAYGSNASPGRLVAKGLDRAGAVLLPARLAGFAPAFEHRRTVYGSVPLTLVPITCGVHDTWVLGLPADATDLLDRTEGRVPDGAPLTVGPESGDGRFAPPGTYQLARVGEVAVADRFVLRDALAYLPGPATRVQVVDERRWRTWPRWDQSAAVVHVDASGPDRPAPDVEEAVLGAWPTTPLTDLPLFVYGTLRPDGVAWGRIADLVRVVGPATTVGALYDLGRGWPAATFDDPVAGGPRSTARIRGVLLAPRGPVAATELFERADRYEGVPELFTRTSIQVDGSWGRSWAAGYAWAGPEPAGAPIEAGE